MRITTALGFCLAARLAAAAPVVVVPPHTDPRDLEPRQIFASELENGDSSRCPEAIFIFARATFEPGNIVSLKLSLVQWEFTGDNIPLISQNPYQKLTLDDQLRASPLVPLWQASCASPSMSGSRAWAGLTRPLFCQTSCQRALMTTRSRRHYGFSISPTQSVPGRQSLLAGTGW